jgi:hypothetical protein
MGESRSVLLGLGFGEGVEVVHGDRRQGHEQSGQEERPRVDSKQGLRGLLGSRRVVSRRGKEESGEEALLDGRQRVRQGAHRLVEARVALSLV